MASQFGGIPVDTAAAPGGSQFGGVPVVQPSAQSPVAEFGSTLWNDLKNLPAGIMAFARHPIDTTGQALESFSNLPDTLAKEYESGHGGAAAAHMTELVGVPKLPEAVGAVANAVGKGASAAADILPKLANSPEFRLAKDSGLAGNIVGAVAPQVKHGAAAAATVAKIGRMVAQRFLPEAAETAPAPAPASRIIPGEGPAPARPDWRQAVVDELNKPGQPYTPPAAAAPTPAAPAPAAAAPAPAPAEAAAPAAPAAPSAPQPQATAPAPAAAQPQPTASVPEAWKSQAGVMSRTAAKSIQDYQSVAQDAKAKALATFLHLDGNGITSAEAANMGPTEWKLAADGATSFARQQGGAAAKLSARINPPNTPATIRKTIEAMKNLENVRALKQQMADAFNAGTAQQ